MLKLFILAYFSCSSGAYSSEKEKVEGEELQKWLRMVVAPTELATFVKGTQQPLLPS